LRSVSIMTASIFSFDLIAPKLPQIGCSDKSPATERPGH